MWNKPAKSLYLILFSIFIGACSTLPDQKNLNIRAEKAAQNSKQSEQSALQSAKVKLQKANTELLAFYAPTYLEQAQSEYAQATKLYNQKESSEEIRLHAQLTVEWIEAGLRNKKMVREYLSASLANRAVLLNLKANEHFPESFKEIEDKHLALIKQIEQRKEVQSQQDEKPLLKAMSELEVRTIGHTYLSQSYVMLQQATALGADKYLVNTHKEIIDQLKSTEQYIRQNPRDKKTIKGLADDSLFLSERLFSLARLANQMQQAKEGNLEAVVLKQEQLLQQISEAIHYKDIRNLSLEDQSLLISQFAGKVLKNKYKTTPATNNKKELEKWKRKVVLLQAEIRRLEKSAQ
ncbi:MAG: hypothetical protein JXR16_10665 [Bermanella sp.]